MFDLQATIKWVSTLLKDAQGAATGYRAADPGWQASFLQLTLPVYVGAFVVASILGLISSTGFMQGSVLLILFSLVWGLGFTFVIAYIFNYLAGVFDGEPSFDRAYALVALSIIPSALGTAISPLPWIGWLISLAAGVYSLILAYQFIPVFLALPEASRVKHFLLSIVVAIIVNIVVSMTLGSAFGPSVAERLQQDIQTNDIPGESGEGGLFSGMSRQADITEAATNDTYVPPADGKLTEAQVSRYVDVLRKTQALRERMSAKVESMDDKEPSFSDVFSGIGGMVRLGTAEMEVVKTGGGNWAEHQWVKAQLETARIQQDLNDTTAHNFELFQQYSSDIEQYE